MNHLAMDLLLVLLAYGCLSRLSGMGRPRAIRLVRTRSPDTRRCSE